MCIVMQQSNGAHACQGHKGPRQRGCCHRVLRTWTTHGGPTIKPCVCLTWSNQHSPLRHPAECPWPPPVM
jgi:hypothetical protein